MTTDHTASLRPSRGQVGVQPALKASDEEMTVRLTGMIAWAALVLVTLATWGLLLWVWLNHTWSS